MKKITLLLATLFSLNGFAQTTAQVTKMAFSPATVQGTKMAKVDPAKDQAKVFNKKIITGFETNTDAKPASERPANPIDGSSFQRASTEIVLGETTYDLQTNASMQDRIHNHGGGNLSAVWTYSSSGDLGATDRGTGYTNFNTTTTAPTQPTARIENAKTGWPNIDMVNGNEISMAHNIPNSSLTMIQNAGPGSASWAQTDLNTGDQVWNRMGTNGGSIIHHVSLRSPSGLGGGIFNGVDGALLYYRSQDGGLTWDISEQFIPGLDASNYSTMAGDNYTLQVRDSIVAVAYWGDMVPTILAKSTDNGDTWEWNSIVNHGFDYDAGSNNTNQALGPIGISDADGDGNADTLNATDGSGAMIIDENGMVHITYGNMRYIDNTPGDDSWSTFPATNGLMYWNESMGDNAAVLIMAALDLDGDQQIGGVSFASGVWTGGEYFTSLSGIPHMSLGDDGDIYVAASVYMETIDQGLQNYRHIYITKTSDKGCSWTQQVDVTPQTSAGGLGECVFASLAATDTEVHLVYQRDFEPGLAVRGDEDPFGNNEIVYVNIPVADIDAEPLALCYTFLDEPEYTAMCPGDSVWMSTSCGLSYSWSNGETTDMVYETIGVHTVSITNACSITDTHTITLTDATGTVPPMFELSATDDIICNGDSSYITASPVSDATYSWSNGGSGSTIGVDATGVYSVTVSNCGGIGSDTITIALPSPPVAQVSGIQTFCLGDSTLLTGSSEPGASYLWSNGATSQSTYATTTGAFGLTVTNCSGSDATTYALSNTLPPAPTFTISDNFFCEGTSTANLVAFGGVTYLWSDGSAGQSTSVSAVGATTMNVTASNACGDMASATAATVTIFANPATPTLTANTAGGTATFTSTAPNNVWYANGSLVQTSGDTYSAPTINLSGVNITAIAVDMNSCISNASAPVSITAQPCDTTIINLTTTSQNESSVGANDGQATVVAAGGMSPYAYLWDNGNPTATAGGLSAGNYTVTVTDNNGCYAITDVTITTLTVLPCDTTIINLTTSSQDESVAGANDGQATVVAAGGFSPYLYLWNNGNPTATAGGLSAGNYAVTVTDSNGCYAIAAVTITVFNPCDTTSLAVSISFQNETSSGANDGQATAAATGGAAPYSYLWDNGNPTNAAAGLTAGTYTVTASDANGCTAIATTTISVGLIISDKETKMNLTIFPNPVEESALIKFSNPGQQMVQVQLFDLSGKMIRIIETKNDQTVLNLSELSQGMYTVKLINSTHFEGLKLIKN